MTLTLAEQPFTKKRVGAHYVWKDDLDIAFAFAAENGVQLFLSDAPYQVAKLVGDDVKLVIYPHKTTAFNYHLRIRDEGSKNRLRALQIMKGLDAAAGFNCTFSAHMNTRFAVRRVPQ